jgi:hypothetical protein
MAQYEKVKDETIEHRMRFQDDNRQVGHLKDKLAHQEQLLKEKDEAIHDLKMEIRDAADSLTDARIQYDLLNDTFTTQQSKTAQYEEEELRLETGKGSEEAETNMKKLNRMLEKSNTLYAELGDRASKSESKLRALEKELQTSKSGGHPLVKFVGPSTSFLLIDNGFFTENPAAAIDARTIRLGDYTKEEKVRQRAASISEGGQCLEGMMAQYLLSKEKHRKEIEPILYRIHKISPQETRYPQRTHF